MSRTCGAEEDKSEENFAEILDCPKEYCTKSKEELIAFKPQIIQYLKSHYPIKIKDFELGLNRKGKMNSRLIVYEFPEDRRKAREYSRRNVNNWYCCQCYSKNSLIIKALLIEDIVLVPFNHSCQPREASVVLKNQRSLKNIKKKANNTSSSSSRVRMNASLSSSFASSAQMESSAFSDSELFNERTSSTSQPALLQNSSEQNDLRDSSSRFSRTAKSAASLNISNYMQNLNSVETINRDRQIVHHNAPSEELQNLFPRDPEEIQRIYVNLAANLAEYTSEAVETNEGLKHEILEILKSHRPLKLSEWKFGLNFSLTPKMRIICFENNDLQKVREYGAGNKGNFWYCQESNKSCKRNLEYFHGIVFVPLNHSCKERDLTYVLEVQELLKAGNKSAAIRLRRIKEIRTVQNLNQNENATNSSESTSSVTNPNPTGISNQNLEHLGNEIPAEMISTENGATNFQNSQNNILPSDNQNALENKFNERGSSVRAMPTGDLKRSFEVFRNGNDEIQLQLPNHEQSFENHDISCNDIVEIPAKRPKLEIMEDVTFIKENQEVCTIVNQVNQVVQKNINDSNNDIVEIPHCPSNLPQNVSLSTNANLNVEEEENDDCVIVDVKPQITQLQPSNVSFHFDLSTEWLRNVCEKKLNIEFKDEAWKEIWRKIEFLKVGQPSTSIQLHDFKSKNFYDVLSKIFTNNLECSLNLRLIIIEAFQKDLINSGKMSQREMDNFFMNSMNPSAVTNQHLSFIAKYLSCRICIYTESNLQKFGQWNPQERLYTFVFGFFDGFYSIILNL